MKIPILAIIGIALLLIGFSPDILATVNIDTQDPIIQGSWPGGSSSSPSAMSPGTTYTLWAQVYESGSGLVSVQVSINSGSWRTMTYKSTLLAYTYRYETTYTTPSAPGTIRFDWKATDRAGRTGTRTTYGTITEPTADGYINNQKVTSSSTIYLTTRNLSFKMVPTQGANLIQGGTVEISGAATAKVILSKSGDVWVGSWTAPSDGTYKMTMYLKAFEAEHYRQIFSLLTGIGEEPTYSTPEDSFLWLKIIGVVLIVGGFIVKK